MTDRERLIELLEDFDRTYDCFRVRCEQIADHLLANGVIVPPCKVGNEIFTIIKGKVVAHIVEKIELHKNGFISFCFSWHACGYEHKLESDFGKTVFLTKEEAEEKLKEREGK